MHLGNKLESMQPEKTTHNFVKPPVKKAKEKEILLENNMP